jgi:hypothetical protein
MKYRITSVSGHIYKSIVEMKNVKVMTNGVFTVRLTQEQKMHNITFPPVKEKITLFIEAPTHEELLKIITTYHNGAIVNKSRFNEFDVDIEIYDQWIE